VIEVAAPPAANGSLPPPRHYVTQAAIFQALYWHYFAVPLPAAVRAACDAQIADAFGCVLPTTTAAAAAAATGAAADPHLAQLSGRLRRTSQQPPMRITVYPHGGPAPTNYASPPLSTTDDGVELQDFGALEAAEQQRPQAAASRAAVFDVAMSSVHAVRREYAAVTLQRWWRHFARSI
jgi:hypothetical protein